MLTPKLELCLLSRLLRFQLHGDKFRGGSRQFAEPGCLRELWRDICGRCTQTGVKKHSAFFFSSCLILVFYEGIGRNRGWGLRLATCLASGLWHLSNQKILFQTVFNVLNYWMKQRNETNWSIDAPGKTMAVHGELMSMKQVYAHMHITKPCTHFNWLDGR